MQDGTQNGSRSGVRIVVTELKNDMGSDEASLTVRMETGTDGVVRHSDFVSLTVSVKQLYDTARIGPGNLPYELTTAQYDALEYDAKLWEVIKKGMDLLSYSDQTRSALITKLRSRGFDRELSEEAADEIVRMGYIDEARMLERAVDSLANGKLYGPARVKAELIHKGFSRGVLDGRLEGFLAEIDFEGNLRKLVERKLDAAKADDPAYREKLCASLFRLGYPPSETRAVIRQLRREREDQSV